MDKAYGTPESDKVVWKKGVSKLPDDKIGEALSRGDLYKKVFWNHPKNDIRLVLAKVERGLSLQVILNR